MKVLVFPALLAIAICVSPPKPFASAQASKAVTVHIPAPVKPVTSAKAPVHSVPVSRSATSQPAPSAEQHYTARR